MLTFLAQTTVSTGKQVVDIAAQSDSITTIKTVGKLIEMGAGTVLSVGGLALLVYLLMGGFNWLTSGGDKGKVESARNMITQGIIGLAILASVFALYGVVLRFLGIKNINLGSQGSTTQGNLVIPDECSDYCAGTTKTGSQYHPDQCENQNGHRVAKRCSGGACAGETYPCKI